MVRQACARDATSVGRFLVGLSPADRYQRFFSAFHHVLPDLIRQLVALASGRLILIALHADAVVGHVRAVRGGGYAVATGTVVTGAHQHQGNGRRSPRRMTGSLSALARTEVRCDVLSGNHVVLDRLRRLFPAARFERDGETVTLCGRLST